MELTIDDINLAVSGSRADEPQASLRVLRQAGMIGLQKQAGYETPYDSRPLNALLYSEKDEERKLYVSDAACDYLLQILDSEFTRGLPEWLCKAQLRGEQIPELFAGLVVIHASQSRNWYVPPYLIPVLPPIFFWMAEQFYSEWQWLNHIEGTIIREYEIVNTDRKLRHLLQHRSNFENVIRNLGRRYPTAWGYPFTEAYIANVKRTLRSGSVSDSWIQKVVEASHFIHPDFADDFAALYAQLKAAMSQPESLDYRWMIDFHYFRRDMLRAFEMGA